MNKIRAITLGMTFSGLSATYYKYCCQQPKIIIPNQSKSFFKSRDQHLQEIINNSQYDIVVIGGGCNGTGVLLDAATRGFKSLLIQKNDFSSGASSKSTKLIHGGVRYLEQVFAFNKDSLSSRYEKFKLVQQAITQRSHMIQNAQYLTHKIPFVIPSPNIFKTAYYYAGSVVYYLIYAWYAPRGSTFFHFPTFMNKSQLQKFFPFLSNNYKTGIVYEDGSFNDSRMIIAALLTATQGNQRKMPTQFKPANILNQAEFIDFIKNQSTKQIQGVIFKDKLTGKQYKIKCKYVVNCAGAWADQVRHKDDPNLPKKLCHVGGSHITYDQKIASSKYGLTMPSKDGRVTLVVPWMGRVIAGTTQKKFDEPDSNPICSQQERIFINQAMSKAMDKLSPQKILQFQKTRWCGLRPLVLNGTAQNTKDISRTHFIQKNESGLYTLIGGKWTIFRKMGQDIVDLIAKQQKNKGKIYAESVTKKLPLIGSATQIYKDQLIQDHGIIGLHLYENYGTRAEQILKGDLTQLIGPITISQLKYIIKNQMPTSPEDILMRRTRSTFLLQKQKVIKMIPIICKLMKQQNLIKVPDDEMLSYMQSVADKINSYSFT